MQTLTEKELQALKAAKNEQEWNDVISSIKNARGGGYPSDWYAKVIARRQDFPSQKLSLKIQVL